MRRTLLFLPGNNPGNLQSGAVFGADGIILDLEDSVSPAEKDAARLLVASALKSVDYAGVERAVRINTLATGGEADIAAVVPCRPDAVMLPKTTSVPAKHCSKRLKRPAAQRRRPSSCRSLKRRWGSPGVSKLPWRANA